MEWSIILPIVATFINLLVLAIGGTLFLAKMEARQAAALSSHREEVNRVINEVRELAVEQSSIARREFGETVQAIRTKIHEFETWTRDTFVRRDSFLIVGDKIDKRLDRIDAKLDALQQSLVTAAIPIKD